MHTVIKINEKIFKIDLDSIGVQMRKNLLDLVSSSVRDIEKSSMNSADKKRIIKNIQDGQIKLSEAISQATDDFVSTTSSMIEALNEAMVKQQSAMNKLAKDLDETKQTMKVISGNYNPTT